MTVSLHTLRPAQGSRKRTKRVGCGQGSGHGKTSTRGTKGQRSRSGDGKLVGFEGGQNPIFRRIPKRGFRNTRFRKKYQIVHLKDLAHVFKNQNEVNLEDLSRHDLIGGRLRVKILGDGELHKPLKIQAHAVSRKALEKIQKAGGSIEMIKS